jgi:hypothetical protein
LSIYVVRLPGGGRISQRTRRDQLSWLGYRDYSIQKDIYVSIINLVKETPDSKFVFISGGVGAFIYSDFCNDLGLDHSFAAKVGIDIISIMHQILIETMRNDKVSIYPQEVKLKDLKSIITENNNQCFFVKPDVECMSSDSLAIKASINIDSDLTIFIKEGAPTYHVGFNEPTTMIQWHIDDITSKAEKCFAEGNGHYLLDMESCTLIKKFNITSVITSPLEIPFIKCISNSIESSNKQRITEVVL